LIFLEVGIERRRLGISQAFKHVRGRFQKGERPAAALWRRGGRCAPEWRQCLKRKKDTYATHEGIPGFPKRDELAYQFIVHHKTEKRRCRGAEGRSLVIETGWLLTIRIGVTMCRNSDREMEQLSTTALWAAQAV